jgi:hypothetical protein
MGFFPSHLGHLSCPLGESQDVKILLDILERCDILDEMNLLVISRREKL